MFKVALLGCLIFANARVSSLFRVLSLHSNVLWNKSSLHNGLIPLLLVTRLFKPYGSIRTLIPNKKTDLVCVKISNQP